MLKKLCDIIEYNFKNQDLLKTALTHSSYANEAKNKRISDNERLEFLGDSVLGLVTTTYLYNKYPDVMEGELTKKRASLVCETSLCKCARKISLGEFLLLGRGEESGGGRDRDSILADAFEALIGALYLDAGEEVARNFVHKFVLSDGKGECSDYKTTLQEIVQKNHGEILSYRLLSAEGPDHHKSFRVEVLLNSNVIGRGEGHSKKEAEQMAAREALELMGL